MVEELVAIRARTLTEIGIGVQHLPNYVQRRSWRHRHDAIEMNYVVRGWCRHRIGDQITECGPGSLGVVQRGERHDLLTGKDGIEVINLYLDSERCPIPACGADVQSTLARLLPMHPGVGHPCNRFVHARFAPHGAVERILRAMLDEQSARRPGHGEAMRSLLRLLLIAWARAAHDDGLRLDAGGSTADKLEDLRIRLDERLDLRVDLAALAHEYGVSRHHLCRAFTRHAGVSITAYQARARINAALNALRSGRERVHDIARACGFADISYFNRTFRRLIGMTPGAWRKMGKT